MVNLTDPSRLGLVFALNTFEKNNLVKTQLTILSMQKHLVIEQFLGRRLLIGKKGGG